MSVKILIDTMLERGRMAPGSTRVGSSLVVCLKVLKSSMTLSVCLIPSSMSSIALCVEVTIFRSLERLAA